MVEFFTTIHIYNIFLTKTCGGGKYCYICNR